MCVMHMYIDSIYDIHIYILVIGHPSAESIDADLVYAFLFVLGIPPEWSVWQALCSVALRKLLEPSSAQAQETDAAVAVVPQDLIL